MIISANLTHAEGDNWWSGNLELDNPASFQRVQIDDPITLYLGGETFALIVDNKTIDRNGVGMPRFTVAVVSPTARFASPRATLIDQIWDTPVMARDAAASVVGEEIQWDLVDWQILGGRLAVHNAAPIEVVKTIAGAAGGVVETLPNGKLWVRHPFPVPVPNWATATPDHILTDAADNLSCRESHIFRKRVNRVLVRGYLPQAGFLSIELDARPDGLNASRPDVLKTGVNGFDLNDTAYFLTHVGKDVTGLAVASSAGLLMPGPSQTFQLTEDIVFDGTDTKTLDKPADSIDSAIWIGNDLGALTLESDQHTLSATSSGVAIARITYTTTASSWSLTSPGSIPGVDFVPVEVRMTGQSGINPLDGEIICQRGQGEFPGDDISDPLLTDTRAKLARGRAVIDAGEELQTVSLTCIHRTGLLPGQLVEVHDAMMGQTWRGKVTSVGHAAAGPKLVTSLELLRYVTTR